MNTTTKITKKQAKEMIYKRRQGNGWIVVSCELDGYGRVAKRYESSEMNYFVACGAVREMREELRQSGIFSGN
jgi:hypothetical protein